MKNHELIAKLQTYDPDAEVFTFDSGLGHGPPAIEEIRYEVDPRNPKDIISHLMHRVGYDHLPIGLRIS